MTNFAVGDKVTHAVKGDAEIAFGPFSSAFNSEAYVLLLPDGSLFGAVTATNLTARPEFAVGDLATHANHGNVTVTYGPFTSGKISGLYLAHDSAQVAHTVRAANLIPRAAQPAVGDKVRVTDGECDTDYVGRVGTLEADDETSVPYRVRFSDGDYTWAATVESI